MKTKKTKRANLENYKSIFFQIGIILTLSAILVAFEWKSAVKIKKLTDNRQKWEDITEVPPVTMPKEETPQEVKPPALTFSQVNDNVVIEDEPMFWEPEDTWDDIIDPSIFEKREEKVDDKEYLRVQIMPKFMGKDAVYFRNYIIENLKFPESASDNGIKGKVLVSFVVDKDGSVTKVEILRGVHPVIDKAVIDVIKNSPKWEPGIQQGKYVKVKFSIAIAFDLI